MHSGTTRPERLRFCSTLCFSSCHEVTPCLPAVHPLCAFSLIQQCRTCREIKNRRAPRATVLYSSRVRILALLLLFVFVFPFVCLFVSFMLASWGGCDKIYLVVIARIKLFGLMRGGVFILVNSLTFGAPIRWFSGNFRACAFPGLVHV